MATNFVDRVVLHVAAGKGGHGVASVHREKFKPLGGPDGGNGGHGGDVVLVVDPQVTTLLDYHRSPHRRATNGAPGAGDERNGADGQDLVLPVPEGTVVKTAPFGAFVNLFPGQDGMLHISQISEQRIEKVEDVINVGDKIQVEIADIDNRGKISLVPVEDGE